MKYIFLKLLHKDNTWCKGHWDTYGFDYDTMRVGVIWPLEEQTLEQLKERLEEDGISFEEFEVENVDRFFGLEAI